MLRTLDLSLEKNIPQGRQLWVALGLKLLKQAVPTPTPLVPFELRVCSGTFKNQDGSSAYGIQSLPLKECPSRLGIEPMTIFDIDQSVSLEKPNHPKK